jgi:hypothetical protein
VPDDPRLLRLIDLDDMTITVRCPCGRCTEFLRGVLQRRHRMPSDTLVIDLQYRLRCSHCRRNRGFRIELLRESDRGRPDWKDRQIVVAEGDPADPRKGC